jgi:hypothetical protein
VVSVGGRGNVVTDWGRIRGKMKMGKRVHKKAQKK